MYKNFVVVTVKGIFLFGAVVAVSIILYNLWRVVQEPDKKVWDFVISGVFALLVSMGGYGIAQVVSRLVK